MTSRHSRTLLWIRSPVSMLLLWTLWMIMVAGIVGAPPRDVIDSDEGEERWLADGSFYDLEYMGDQPQADWQGPATGDLCPPVPKRLPLGGCDVKSCSSDRECAQWGLKCCYNGCTYTCLPEVKPPPHLDWIKEPVRRIQFGQSWLVPGVDQVVDVEMCSTTPVEDDSDPLVCPHGYVCSIDDVGSPQQGIPNRGHCVKLTDDVTPKSVHYGDGGDLYDLYGNQADDPDVEDRASLHACSLDDQQILLSGHTIVIEEQECLCFETQLICDK